MKLSTLSLFAGVLALVAAGCGGGGSSAAGSCTTMSSGSTSCVEFGAGYTSSSVMAACSSPSTYSASGCASAMRVGRCATSTTSGSSTFAYTTSFYSPATTDQAMQACTALSGTFTAN